MSQTLLAAFAHPDDETFLAGALLARCAAEGVRVEVLCATPGPPRDPARADWRALARARLHDAAQVLGVQAVRFLDYEGSPMLNAGTRSRDMLVAAPPGAVAERVAAVVREVQPDVVLTDSPYGTYGHPDHIAMHRAVVAAFHEVAPPDARLYALAFPLPLSLLRALTGLGPVMGWLGLTGHLELKSILASTTPGTVVLDVRDYVGHRRRAVRCYPGAVATAIPPLKALERAPLWTQQRLLGRAALTRLWPPPSGYEDGLF